MTTVVVGGALANKCGVAGEAWVRMSWAVGLRRLGFEVMFLEEIESGHCTNGAGAPERLERSVQWSWFASVIEQFGLGGSAALVSDCGEIGGEVGGMDRADLLDRLDDAALLVNISGHVRTPDLLRRARRKAFVDIDPGFTQIWHADGNVGASLAGHDAFFTIGENIGRPGCPLPTGDIRWRATRQPVLLDQWPAMAEAPERGFTTVATWRPPYGRPSLAGHTYGLKVHEFRRLLDLPTRCRPQRFELALDIDEADDADLRALRDHGWDVVDPATVAGTVPDYRRYVASSTAELSCAQGVYVESSCGWFSDRSVRYLASGRPVVVQDTGFSQNVPVGEGLFAFTDTEGAAAAVSEVSSDYERHAKAARVLAEQEFAAEDVLGRFLEDLDVAP